MSDARHLENSPLAARLRATLDRRVSDAKQAKESERLRVERFAAAVTELADNLEGFGRAVGYFGVSRRKNDVTFQFEGRVLCFEAPRGGAEGASERVRVTGDRLGPETPFGEPVIVWEETLGKWIVQRTDRRKRLQQAPLFDVGLAELIAAALGIEEEVSAGR